MGSDLGQFSRGAHLARSCVGFRERAERGFEETPVLLMDKVWGLGSWTHEFRAPERARSKEAFRTPTIWVFGVRSLDLRLVFGESFLKFQLFMKVS